MSLKQKVLAGIFWTFTQQFSSQIISFVVSLVLARILLPSDFGTIAVFSILMGIGNVLIESGLTNSLIRTKDINDTDLSTVFYFNLIVSILVYVILVLTASWVADFFRMPVLTTVIRIYALILPINAFSSVQRTILTKKLDFKTQLKIQIPSLIIGGGAGIAFAIMDFGIWALVYMTIIQSALSSIQFWIYSKWRPKKVFDKDKFKFHFNFGYKLALSGLIDTIFQNVYTIVIGKIFNATQLGFYNRANSMQQLPVTSISGALNRVTYPLFSEIQNDDDRLKKAYRLIMKMVIFIVAPILTIMGVLGEPIFRFLFTDKWLPAVPYFQILCITGILYPLHAYNLNILQVKGRSDLFLKLELIKKIIVVTMVAVTFRFGITGLLWGQVITSIISLFINCHYSGKFLHYNVWKQLGDILPSVILSGIVGGLVMLLDVHILAKTWDFVRLFTGGIFAFLSYFLFAYLFRFKELSYLKDILGYRK